LGLVGSVRADAGPYAPAAAVEPGAQPMVSDQAITADIQARLEKIQVLRNSQVTIATKDGTVTLTGTVPNVFAKDKALEAVRATPGVAVVNDQLRLEISSPQAPTRN
jgi:hyperosmotically inducible protein